jgi:serine/threonine protein kinase/Tfp pilus assembly protein PilF
MTLDSSNQPGSPGNGEQETRNHTAGQKIGNYQLLELIGEGGMGEVYLAEQTHPIRRQVAIKIVKLGMDTAEFTARFESERQALALMDHPHIAKVFDAGATERGRPYFVMEYVQGVPINKYCDDLNLDLRSRLELFIRVCEGIQHAHQKAIIHRDIKPSNVLVTSKDGEVWPKIIDFGVAKALDQKLTEHTLQTAMGQIMGTPEYMSPEQADLVESSIDTRTDIYLLGELLYILLAGVPPFDPEELKAQGLHAMLYQIRSIDPPRPSRRLAELAVEKCEGIAAHRATSATRLIGAVQGDLDWITMRALEKEQDLRYQTSNALILEIGRYLNDEPVLAGPPSTNYRVRKFVKRNRIKVGAAAMVLAALVLGITGTTVGLVKSKAAEALARTEAETSRQISDFMVSLFQVSDPTEALGNTITAREILDQGVQRIEAGLAEQPETQARLMNTMGHVYKELGLYGDARPLLEKSLGTLETIGAANEPEAAEVMDNLGGLLRVSGNYDEAGAVLERALALRVSARGPEHLEVAQSLNSLANLKWQIEQLDQAEQLYLRALAIREKKLGPDHPDVAITLNNLGGVRMQGGKYEGAREVFERALAIREAALGPEHPDTARSLRNLGQLMMAQGEYQQARNLSQRVLAINRKVYGPEHPSVALSLDDLAGSLVALGDLDQAQSLFEQAISIQEAALGPDHLDLANFKLNLASLLISLRDFPPAIDLSRQVLAIREKNLGPDHLDVARALNSLAACMLSTGDPEVFANLERALAIQKKSLDPDDLELALTYHNMGGAYFGTGDLPASQANYRRSLEIREKKLPAGHPDHIASLQALGNAHLNAFELDLAKPLLESSRDLSAQTMGVSHPGFASSLSDLGLLRYYQGRLDDAESLFKQAVVIQEATLPPGSYYLMSNYINLGCISAALGKSEVALNYLGQAADGGFAYPAIMEDPDLMSLHGDPRFREIVDEMNGFSR